MVQWEKTNKPDNLRLNPEPHMVEGETRLPKVLVCSDLHTFKDAHVHTQIHTDTNIIYIIIIL